MENAFNPKEFAILLSKLIGSRKIQDFAAQAGVSKFQISRRLAGVLDAPPRKKTLKQFAAYAENGVTYEDLLKCAGYPEGERRSVQSAQDKRIKVARACLLSAVSDLHLPVRPSGEDAALPCDFELIIGTDPEVAWDISVFPADMPLPIVQQKVKKRLQDLMYARLRAYTKYSILTENQKIFDACFSQVPVNLNVNVSIILYSPEDLEVICEDILSSSSQYPIPREYCLKKKDPSKED